MQEVQKLWNGTVSEKIPKNFQPTLHTEYLTVFSGRTDAPEARCDLTDGHTHTGRTTTITLAHARRGLTRNRRIGKIIDNRDYVARIGNGIISSMLRFLYTCLHTLMCPDDACASARHAKQLCCMLIKNG